MWAVLILGIGSTGPLAGQSPGSTELDGCTFVSADDVIWVQTYGKGAGAGTLEKTRAITEKLVEGYKKARP